MGNCARLALVMLVLVACDGKLPGPVAGAAAPVMPADHPPIGAVGAVAAGPRLPPGTVMARFGAGVITAGDLDKAISVMPAPDRLEYSSVETVRDLVESLVDRRLMAAAARKEGLDRDLAIRGMLAAPANGDARDTDEVLAGAWLEAELAKLPVPGEADVVRYYREHAAEFTEPKRVRVTRVIAQSEKAAERVRGELGRGANAEALKAGVAGAVVSADQLWLQQVPKQTGMTTIALALRPGQVTAVLPADNGFAVLRAEEAVAARARPLDEVKAGIMASLQEGSRATAMQAIRERLRKGVEVSIVEDALSSYLAAPAAAPAATATMP